MSVEIRMVDSNLKKSYKFVGCIPEEVKFGGTGTSSFSLTKLSGENGLFLRRSRENKEYNNMHGRQIYVENFSWEPIMVSLLGLLAKIKCSICSHQHLVWGNSSLDITTK